MDGVIVSALQNDGLCHVTLSGELDLATASILHVALASASGNVVVTAMI